MKHWPILVMSPLTLVLFAQQECDSDADGDGWTTDDGDCDDRDSNTHPGASELCDAIDNDCDGEVDEVDDDASLCDGCQAGLCPVAEVRDGSLEVDVDLAYQYSPLDAGTGYLKANWNAVEGAFGYLLSVGTAPGVEDLVSPHDIGNVTSIMLEGLTVLGAWEGARYYVTIAPVGRDGSVGTPRSSDGVGVAELEFWDGVSTEGLRGGHSENWPAEGLRAFFGAHYFESVQIESGTLVRVQGFGHEDGVPEGVSSTDTAVLAPKDGWLSLYANSIRLDGEIHASGRGYGGGGGGGGGEPSSGQCGRGGVGGLGGDGGDGESSYTGGGGGGSPFGIGGYGPEGDGGNGQMSGGGSGSTACSGTAGKSSADGVLSDIGSTGGTATYGAPGAGGAGEFENGGAQGVSGCDNWSGGGGGGYGAGGGGGTQWTGFDTEAGGGGGGGTGGSGGGDTGNGANGAGPFGGTGGVANLDSSRSGAIGSVGGYLGAGVNGDSSTDWSLALGSGGGGGGGGYQEASGGGGGAGGGAILLSALDLYIGANARILANGAGGGGGGYDAGGSSVGAAGGGGAGGGVLIGGEQVVVEGEMNSRISTRGADGNNGNGGSLKLFYGTWEGPMPDSSQAGRLYDVGAGSYSVP